MSLQMGGRGDCKSFCEIGDADEHDDEGLNGVGFFTIRKPGYDFQR